METVRRDNTVAHDVPDPRCRRKPHSHRILQVASTFSDDGENFAAQPRSCVLR
ncbi:uncharacterized protein G2W53_040666 [Senna tora]|uniref:Uncharacterized protein n=1 Tax=Senna tora TaxID=362788 RepID=A0A834SFG7_9FABA|nr:uncharacterized protein G2W53_040666 [Senna tora]